MEHFFGELGKKKGAIFIVCLVILGVAVIIGATSAVRHLARAFVGPGVGAGIGAGAIGVDASNNVSMGSSSTLPDTKVYIQASSTSNQEYALRITQPPLGLGPIFFVRNDGHVSITTTTSDAYTLTVQGDVFISGNITGGGAVSNSINAGWVTPGTFGQSAGTTGNYSFPASLAVNRGGVVGSGAFAVGPGTIAWGNGSAIALGSSTVALANIAMALGTSIWVTGTSSVGIGLDTTPRTLAQPNTLAIVGGNVVIGSVTPSSTLEVAGTIHATGDICTEVNVNCLSQVATISGGIAANKVTFWNSTSTLGSDTNFSWDNANKRLGIGVSNPAYQLEVSSSLRLIPTLTVPSSNEGAFYYASSTGRFKCYERTTGWVDCTAGNLWSVISGNDIKNTLTGTVNLQKGLASGVNSGSSANGNYAVALGNNAQAPGDSGIAIGSNVSAGGNKSIAIGRNVTSTGDSAMALGRNAVVTGNSSIAVGLDTVTSYTTALNSVFTINGGNVGIGTVAPTTPLMVVGNAVFMNSVGIGTSTPSVPLELVTSLTGSSGLNPSFKIVNTTQNSAEINFSPGGTANTWNIGASPTNPYFRIWRLSGGSKFLHVMLDATGQMGIQANAPANTIPTVGSALHVIDPTTGVINYLQVDTLTAAPPGEDCNAAAEAGRMKYDRSTFRFYMCGGTSGWRYVAFPP